jgi:hypothetical protein
MLETRMMIEMRSGLWRNKTSRRILAKRVRAILKDHHLKIVKGEKLTVGKFWLENQN